MTINTQSVLQLYFKKGYIEIKDVTKFANGYVKEQVYTQECYHVIPKVLGNNYHVSVSKYKRMEEGATTLGTVLGFGAGSYVAGQFPRVKRLPFIARYTLMSACGCGASMFPNFWLWALHLSIPIALFDQSGVVVKWIASATITVKRNALVKYNDLQRYISSYSTPQAIVCTRPEQGEVSMAVASTLVSLQARFDELQSFTFNLQRQLENMSKGPSDAGDLVSL